METETVQHTVIYIKGSKRFVELKTAEGEYLHVHFRLREKGKA